MNCATDDFTVAVEGGVEIPGPIFIPDREIQILGGYSADYTSRDPESNPSVIDGIVDGSTLRFEVGTGPDTVVDGFRITGGGGLFISGIPYSAYYGGGIALSNASPTLRNMEVTDNAVGFGSSLACGGGVMANNSSAILENIHIHGNTAIYGSGMIIYNSDLTMIDCVIEDNIVDAENLSFPPQGGGLHVVASTVTMENCSVDGHTNCELGGGLYVTDDSVINMTGGTISANTAKTNGGGVYMVGGTLNLHGTEVSGNGKLDSSTFMHGGGLYVQEASVVADSTLITGNISQVGGGGPVRRLHRPGLQQFRRPRQHRGLLRRRRDDPGSGQRFVHRHTRWWRTAAPSAVAPASSSPATTPRSATTSSP